MNVLWIYGATPAKREKLTLKLLELLDDKYHVTGVLPSERLLPHRSSTHAMRKKAGLINKPLLHANKDKWAKKSLYPETSKEH